MSGPLDSFTHEEIERARRYHRPLYAALALDLGLGLAVLAALSFGPAGDWLYEPLAGLSWWARALAFPALVVAVAALVRLPLSFWRGYAYERRWGFSTQSVGGWLGDRAKGLMAGTVLTSAALLGLVASVRALPGAWPALAAPAAAGLVLALGFVAPVVLEPLFNRFRPLDDPELAGELRALAERAGVPVREVLVADASRRTRKRNAYVSGLGATRRVVLFDTLLASSEPRQVPLVVAHELAHRRHRDVAVSTALGMVGAAGFVLVLWGLLDSAGDPRKAALVLLLASLGELALMPFGAALSRRRERRADRFSLKLTGDREGYVAAHRELARANLSDLDPPRALYLLTFTHPTAAERIAAARATSSL